MGVIGGLFTKHNDFSATAQNVKDEDLSKYGYNVSNTAPAMGQGLAAAGAGFGMDAAASGMGLQGAQAGMDQSNQANAGQSALAQQLALRAAGKAGPSIAEQQLSQSLGQVQQQGAGSLAAARGVSPGTAARLISNNQTTAAQTAAGQGAVLRSQEQQAAENQLGTVLAAQRSGALGQAQVGFGGFGAGQSASNQGLQTVGAINQGQNQTAAGLSQGNQQSAMDAQRINSGVAAANTAADNATGAGMMNAAGGAATMGLSHGGEVPDTDGGAGEGGYAAGGEVSLAHALLASHRHLSSAHEAIAKYAAGGEVKPEQPAPAPAPAPEEHVPTNDEVRNEGHLPTKRAMEAKRQAAVDSGKVSQNYAGGGEVTPTWGVDLTKESKDDKVRKEGDLKTKKAMEQERETSEDTEALGAAAGQPKKMADGGYVNQVHAEEAPDYTKLQSKPANPFAGAKKRSSGDATPADMSGVSREPLVDSPNAGVLAPDPGAPQQGVLGGDPSLGGMDIPATGAPLMSAGGNVPGHAQVSGNSQKNDTVPTMLSPGEVVLPRTISHDPDAAAQFVEHINARRKMAGGGEVGGLGRVLATQREHQTRLSALEQRLGRE